MCDNFRVVAAAAADIFCFMSNVRFWCMRLGAWARAENLLKRYVALYLLISNL